MTITVEEVKSGTIAYGILNIVKPKEEVKKTKKMTIEEISKELGYDVEIVGGE